MWIIPPPRLIRLPFKKKHIINSKQPFEICYFGANICIGSDREDTLAVTKLTVMSCKLLGFVLLEPEDEGNRIFKKVGNCRHNVASHWLISSALLVKSLNDATLLKSRSMIVLATNDTLSSCLHSGKLRCRIRISGSSPCHWEDTFLRHHSFIFHFISYINTRESDYRPIKIQ
jgi:hypothetical protein